MLRLVLRTVLINLYDDSYLTTGTIINAMQSFEF